VRYLLSRDAPAAPAPAAAPGGGALHSGGLLRRLGHLAGWCGPSAAALPVPDVAFLAHPTTLTSAFAHWGGGGGGGASWEARWEERGWMRAAAPLVWLYSLLWSRLSPLVGGPFLLMDDFAYESLRSQVWLSRAFGWQFLAAPRAAEANVEATLRAADAAGVRVLGLGALNKAEFVNGSGQERPPSPPPLPY